MYFLVNCLYKFLFIKKSFSLYNVGFFRYFKKKSNQSKKISKQNEKFEFKKKFKFKNLN